MKKQFRPPYHVDFHSERGEASIYVTDATGADVWYADTETVNDLLESGYLDARGFIMGRNIRPEVLERSVVSYLKEVGVIPRDRESNPTANYWVIEWFNEDHPVTPSWMEYAAFEDTAEGARDSLDALQRKHPAMEFRLAEDRRRTRFDNPTTADLDQWADKYRKALEPLNDGKPSHPKYIIKMTTKKGDVGYFKGRLKFDTEIGAAKIYRNSERANEAATKVKNLLQKNEPFKAKNIKRLEVIPLDAGK